MTDCGSPLANQQLENYSHEGANILQISDTNARRQAAENFSDEVLSILSPQNSDLVKRRAEELKACNAGGSSDAAPPDVVPNPVPHVLEMSPEMKAATSVAERLSKPGVNFDTVNDVVSRNFKGQSQQTMYRFADEINTMLKSSGISLDVHHFRGNKFNLAVTVSGFSGNRATEVFLGRPGN